MYHDRENLSALIGSRICHDLISPLGAISNGIELLTMNGQTASPEFELISQSVAAANSKIRFFRVAYGNAPVGSTIAQPEIASILTDYFKDRRIEIQWLAMHEALRVDAKIAFLAIQCLEAALPFGGKIEVHHTAQDWHLTASSPQLHIRDPLWQVLLSTERDVDCDASAVQFAMLFEVTRFRNPALEVALSHDMVTMTF